MKMTMRLAGLAARRPATAAADAAGLGLIVVAIVAGFGLG
jgi:hypothetical protein